MKEYLATPSLVLRDICLGMNCFVPAILIVSLILWYPLGIVMGGAGFPASIMMFYLIMRIPRGE